MWEWTKKMNSWKDDNNWLGTLSHVTELQELKESQRLKTAGKWDEDVGESGGHDCRNIWWNHGDRDSRVTELKSSLDSWMIMCACLLHDWHDLKFITYTYKCQLKIVYW